MAIVTRVHGDANGVVNVDNSLSGQPSAGKIISTGIGKHPTAFKITANVDVSGAMGVGDTVESVLRNVGSRSSLLMYQVDAAEISVLVEATGWDDAGLKAALDAAVPAGAPYTVSSTGGFRLA